MARVRRWAIGVGVAAAAVVVVFLLRAPLLTAVARTLTVDDSPRTADAIFLLNGEVESRPAGAADLFHRGFAPVIVIAREEETSATRSGFAANRTDVAVELLRRFGVPDSAVVVVAPPGGVTSTSDEARAFRTYTEGAHPERVIVVTNNFHSRRARWTLRRALRSLDVDVLVAPVPHRHFDETNWWRSEAGLILYLEEFLKFAHYRLRG